LEKFRRKYQKKLEDESKPYEIKDYITDLIGIRVICLYEPDIEKIQDVVSSNFEVIEVTDKIGDLDKTENQFGYKSLHLDLRLNNARKELPENKQYADMQFELQIRTIIQDAWSVLDHKIKYKKNIPEYLKRRINRLAALFELADDEFDSIRSGVTSYENTQKCENNKPNQTLNVVSFREVAEPAFPTYQFISERIDDFVHDIMQINKDLTKEEFEYAITENIEKVKEFNSKIALRSPGHYLNPYTMIRHCLYISNKELYKEILFALQRKNYDDWEVEKQ
jgi:ppGpp synthetase/RelA/SpoT-type nucleotidyltranferase